MTSQAVRCLVVAVAGVSVLATAVGLADATLYRRNVASMGGGGGGNGGGMAAAGGGGGDMAAPKYDSGGYQSSGYSSGGGGYGGGGYGGGGGGYGGGGGGGYGGGGGGGYDALDVGVEVKQEYENAAKTQASNGGGGGGGGGTGQTYDTGNVYYYYYPTQTKGDDHASSYSPSQSSYNSYPPPPPPPAAYPMYYPMQDDKDKDDGGLLGGLVGLGIPAVLAVLLGIPLLLLGLLAAGAALAFFIGRSNDGGYLLSAAFKDDESADGVSPHLPGAITNLSLVRAVHEAFAAYTALSTDESCRQRVVCELGYVLKASEASKGTIISVFDAVMPSSWQHQFKPLKEVLLSGESGKCQKYVCDAAAAALKRGPLKTILGDRHKGAVAAAAGPPILVKTTLNPDTAARTSTPIMSTNTVNATDQHKDNAP